MALVLKVSETLVTFYHLSFKKQHIKTVKNKRGKSKWGGRKKKRIPDDTADRPEGHQSSSRLRDERGCHGNRHECPDNKSDVSRSAAASGDNLSECDMRLTRTFVCLAATQTLTSNMKPHKSRQKRWDSPPPPPQQKHTQTLTFHQDRAWKRAHSCMLHVRQKDKHRARVRTHTDVHKRA